jgi:hypothetical protein
MCASCVAQGIGYVGTALAGLQVMGARAKARRRRSDGEAGVEVAADDAVDAVGAAEPAPAGEPAPV